MRLFRKRRSKVRTDEFTVPLRQVGWGIGYGKTHWYRDETSPELRALFKRLREEENEHK